ncbi:hypothetical protein P3G55_05165 [Leptospira sp. 96542]|nr:hypothetical protein [Leptospira sp. 96542]
MELFSLVLINLLFCGMMYVFISAKVQKAVSEYYDKKLNRAIDMATSETIRELDTTVGVIESRLVALRSMIEKAELIAKEFKHYESSGLSMKEEIIPSSPPKREISLEEKSESKNQTPNLELKEQRQAIGLVYQQNQLAPAKNELETTEGAVNMAFGKLGKAVKGIFGMDQAQSPSAESFGNVDFPVYKPQTSFTIGGDPFQETPTNDGIRNESLDGGKRREFLNEVSKANDPAFASYQKSNLDKVSFSIESALEELPASTSKIDKVVHLIKRGYDHSEISEVMNIGTHEIHLIETIRLDRSRRI